MPNLEKSDALQLIGLGVCTLDCLQAVPEFPTGDHVIHSQSAQLMGGGPVATALVAAAKLGIRTAMVDRIGDDWRGDQVRTEFENAGVDTRWLTTAADSTTAFASVMARRTDGARAIVFASGSAGEYRADDLDDIAFEKARVLHLNGRHWPACLVAAERTRSAGGLVSFDGGAHRYRDEVCELLAISDITIVAAEFASHLADSLDAQLDRLLNYGARIAGVTDGKNGSCFASRDLHTGEIDRFHQPAFEISPLVDTTGCGDTFHGAFLAAHLNDESPRVAARRASAAAALNATELGGRGRLVDNDELDHFLNHRSDQAIATALSHP